MTSLHILIVSCVLSIINVQNVCARSHSDLLTILEYIQDSKNASSLCQAQLEQLLNSFLNGEQWAWKMLDASSKIPSGFQEGNTRDLGHFDECININEQHLDIKGKYCYGGMITAFPKFVNISAIGDLINSTNTSSFSELSNFLQDTMLPTYLKDEKLVSALLPYGKSADQKIDLSSINEILEEYNLVLMFLSLCIPHHCMPSEINLPPFLMSYDEVCSTADSFFNFDKFDFIAIAIILTTIVIMIMSTAYDLHLQSTGKKPLHKILLAYSITTNLKFIMDTTKNSAHLQCFAGLKTISILWVILGHRFTASAEVFAINYNEIDAIKSSWYSEYVQAAQYAVDTFLVLSGCLLTYLALKPMISFKNRIKNYSVPGKASAVVLHTLTGYLHRYLRLTPPVAVLYMYYVTIFRRLGKGPVYNYLTESQRQPCVDHWWSFFLYIENYLNTENMCIVHLWYINVDMQIFIFAPFVIWPIVLYRKQMLYVGLPLLTVAASVVTFLVAYINEIQWYSDDYYNLYYYVTHTRLAPWFIGLALGIILLESKEKKIKINKMLNLFIWFVVLVAIVVLIFAQHDPAYNYERVKTSVWTALHKPAFALCVCWVVWACENGYGGIINKFLSCSIFQIIGKLTYCMYLVQFISITVELARIKVPIYFEDFAMIRSFLADSVMTISLAISWMLAFELPIRAIDKVIFERPKRPRETNANTEKVNNTEKVSIQVAPPDGTKL